ncbi:uncharacterized protein A4U43_C04F21510, partial [Asparagus officinalis]
LFWYEYIPKIETSIMLFLKRPSHDIHLNIDSAEEAAVVTTVDVHDAKGLLGSGHRYLDVRTAEEFSKGHLENSLNVPFMFFTPQGRVRNPDFVEQVSLGCQSGVRSLQASADLLKAGFKNVKNVGGGYAAWLENGFPVKKPEEETSSKPHTEEVVTVDVHSAKGLISSGHCYLDVRTVEEFKKGHLENSLNVPYWFFTPEGKVKNPDFVEQVSLVCNNEDQIVVGCQCGVRSLQASTDLLKAGFKNVKNMGGGYAAWVENDFDVKKFEDEL